MKYSWHFDKENLPKADLILLGAFKDEAKGLSYTSWPKGLKAPFESQKEALNFSGASGQTSAFAHKGQSYIILGLGDKKEWNNESFRRALATGLKSLGMRDQSLAISLSTIKVKSLDNTAELAGQAAELSLYQFVKYHQKEKAFKLKKMTLWVSEDKKASKGIQAAFEKGRHCGESVNLGRDFVNEPPNVLRSDAFAKRVVADAKKLPQVKAKVLGKAELKKEKMNMFLSVNAGSGFPPQLVHLTYTPTKATKKTKHVALIGKGIVFDTGGYSLKPSTSMVNMKFDMAGAATMYAAFRAFVATKPNIKVSCMLGITDNAVNSFATMPDSIVTAKNGMTVEILNTDAEGRLVLGDVITYACEQGADTLIDCATLTGACLVSLGTEVAGLMGNDQKLCDSLLKSSKNAQEYLWQLPIVDEYRKDMKGDHSDLRNIGRTRFGGTSKAAAFLENFVKDGVSWAHLDIAGVGDSQTHLPYCPTKGGSGVMVRTVVDFLENV